MTARRWGPQGGITLTFKDGKYTLKVGDEKDVEDEEGAAHIDPTTTPRSLDLRPTTGRYKGKTVLCIYEVKGDTLRLCIATPGKPRAKAFESKKGSGHSAITARRVKTGG